MKTHYKKGKYQVIPPGVKLKLQIGPEYTTLILIDGNTIKHALAMVESEILEYTRDKYKAKTWGAQSLGIARAAFIYKLKKYGLFKNRGEFEKVVAIESKGLQSKKKNKRNW